MNELDAEGIGIVLYAMSAFAGSNTLRMDMMSLMTALSTPSYQFVASRRKLETTPEPFAYWMACNRQYGSPLC